MVIAVRPDPHGASRRGRAADARSPAGRAGPVPGTALANIACGHPCAPMRLEAFGPGNRNSHTPREGTMPSANLFRTATTAFVFLLVVVTSPTAAETWLSKPLRRV